MNPFNMAVHSLNPITLPARPLLIDGETSERALQRTEATLGKLVEICKKLHLSATVIPQMIEMYDREANVLQAEKARQAERQAAQDSAKRYPMQINSANQAREPIKCRRGERKVVTGRPQWVAYQVMEIEIEGTPSQWIVRSIRVGNQEQLMHCEHPIPGEAFRKGGIMSELRLDVCQTGMDFVMDVEYIGPSDDGEVFGATLVGMAVEYPPNPFGA